MFTAPGSPGPILTEIGTRVAKLPTFGSICTVPSWPQSTRSQLAIPLEPVSANVPVHMVAGVTAGAVGSFELARKRATLGIACPEIAKTCTCIAPFKVWPAWPERESPTFGFRISTVGPPTPDDGLAIALAVVTKNVTLAPASVLAVMTSLSNPGKVEKSCVDRKLMLAVPVVVVGTT